MKKFCLAVPLIALFVIAPAAVRAQGGAKQGPAVTRDLDLEKDSLHNLEVARHYFKLKKAYVAALERCEEIIAGNPAFSKIDEVLFMAGESSLNLADRKGKQPAKLYSKTMTPEQLRELARDYLSRVVSDYPQSSFRPQAEDDLKPLGGLKPKDSKQ